MRVMKDKECFLFNRRLYSYLYIMAKRRWILKFIGSATSISKAKVNALLKGNSISIIDMSLFPKLLLVEGSKEKMNALTSHSDAWTFAPEKSYKIPGTRKKLQPR